jgi:hypothetical protein
VYFNLLKSKRENNFFIPPCLKPNLNKLNELIPWDKVFQSIYTSILMTRHHFPTQFYELIYSFCVNGINLVFIFSLGSFPLPFGNLAWGT